MTTGLLALLDDVAALVKVSATSLDDIPTQLAKTTGKIAGIVIDDAAVTPKYVVGLDPSRELSIIYQIAKRSMINKVFFLGPAALLLGYFAPWAIKPLLMLGGAYLCFEGYEKVHAMFIRHQALDVENESIEMITPDQLEKIRVKSAVQTDFILSAEIVAITYATVADKPFVTQSFVIFCIAIGITVAVYGVVGLIVKADDIGLHMAKHSRYAMTRQIGRSIVKFMPHLLKLLSYIGTAAMLWVGAEIIAHGIPFLHHGLEQIHDRLAQTPVIAWAATVSLCAAGGLVLGAILKKLLVAIRKLRQRM